jgi:hypothetical protein
MTSLGFSEYAETGNTNNEPKNNIRRNGGGGVGGVRQNRTLKIPRNQEVGPVSSNSNETPPSVTGRKIKQIKDYIENIHRKGGEDSDEDPDDSASTSLLPSYPAQGMGVYATNVSHSGVIRGAETVSSNTPQVVRKTTQMNSLNPGSSYSTTLLEGMDTSARTASATHDANSSPYFEKLTGISGSPKKDAVAAAAAANATKTAPFSTNVYASRYYEQFVPYAETLANQLANGSGGGSVSGTNAALIEKLNYIIHMLEEKKDEKTGHVIEELVLYCFLGIFIIFVIDTFTHSAGAGGGISRGGGGGGMFGGMNRRGSQTQYYRR